jgi:hypothetical protein
LLLAKGADTNAKDNLNETASGYAAAKGHLTIVEVLVVGRADITARSNNDAAPLIGATKHNHPDFVKVLLSKGADVNRKTKMIYRYIRFNT